jgi:excisionase family DNA binding protein
MNNFKKIRSFIMAKGKNVLTTGEVAKICNVAPRTATKWFDRGRLKGYRIPGSKDRRIPTQELIRFMKTHNMPIPSFITNRIRLLVIDPSSSFVIVEDDFEVEFVSGLFKVGLMVQRFKPHVLAISILELCLEDTCRTIRTDEELADIKIIVIANKPDSSSFKELSEKGLFDDYIIRAFEPKELFEKARKIVAVSY